MYLFVYGTLTPGRAPACVADLVERFETVGRATVAGDLYDCGAYPGLVLGGSGRVEGLLVRVPGEPRLLQRLDAYEGFDPGSPMKSLFCRVETEVRVGGPSTAAGTMRCWTYVYNRAPTGRRIESGRWFGRENSDVPATNSDPAAPPRRPLIGITMGRNDDKPARYELPGDYALSVERAGGLPVMLPYRLDLARIPDYLGALDGLVFAGGDDLDPALYGEAWHPKAAPIDPDRQRFELALMAEAERRRMPVLGICLGCQLMNVHRGGSLHQHLPDVPREGAFDHRRCGDDSRRHDVTIEPGSLLAGVVGGAAVRVNTRHQQAVNRVGRGLRVSARSPDGVIEGIEDPSLPFFLGLQWHPENLTGDAAEQLAPFKRLVEVAAEAVAPRGSR